MAYIRLLRPDPIRLPDHIELRIQDGILQTRRSTFGRPADSAPYTTGPLQPAPGEEQLALTDRVYAYCRRGWNIDDCRFTQHIAEGGSGALREHFELRCAMNQDLGRFYATCQGLTIINPAFEFTEDKVKNRRFATLRRDGFPLLCIDLLERDAYGTCELDSPLSELLGAVAGLPGFSVSFQSDMDDAAHEIEPTVRYHNTDAGWAAWRDRIGAIAFVAASRPNTPRPMPGYQPFRDRDGSRVTPVVL